MHSSPEIQNQILSVYSPFSSFLKAIPFPWGSFKGVIFPQVFRTEFHLQKFCYRLLKNRLHGCPLWRPVATNQTASGQLQNNILYHLLYPLPHSCVSSHPISVSQSHRLFTLPWIILLSVLLGLRVPLFYFSWFLGPYCRYMEVPGLGVKMELQLSAYATATALQDPSQVCDVHHSSW